MRYVYVTIILFCLQLFVAPAVFAQQVCNQQDPCAGKSSQDKVDCYANVLSICGKAKETLSSQINLLNNQIQLTSLRIESTKSVISKLSVEIGGLETEIQRLELQLTRRTELILRRIPEAYKRASTSQFGLLFFSKDFPDFLSRIKYIDTVQKEDAALLLQLKATQTNFSERKSLREDKKQQQEQAKQELEVQTQQLAAAKKEKNALLVQTQGQESVYQQLLAQARAQLAGFASFADSQGTSLLSGQTSCNDWGCYYNQRDSQWGNALINNRNDCGGPCSIARVGCLITSISMVASHIGFRDILPIDIAFSSPENFAVGTASLMKGTIYVKGKAITRSTISGALTPGVAQSGPVIVGVRYGPFGTHFVVVKTYDNGRYVMNDPYEANGRDMSFTDRYSLGSVFEVDRVSIN